MARLPTETLLPVGYGRRLAIARLQLEHRCKRSGKHIGMSTWSSSNMSGSRSSGTSTPVFPI